MPGSAQLKLTPLNSAAVIGVFVGGLFAIYGFIHDLISSIVDRLK
ncbi:MAG TPA: hypothetical protein VLL06_06690 [Nitrospiraceae bacterium]|nr:hypothetical protein [Nitrospiraceae bacterium]